jgi:enolase-phosphatase E1
MTTRAILLDIEGTTTSIRFVYDTLFPFARAHMEAFLAAEWEDAEVQSDIVALRAQAVEDHNAGLVEAPLVPEGDGTDVHVGAVANLLWQMDSDRKTTALKSIQGKVWRQGYASGALLGHVYADVAPTLNAWHRASLPVYIYSSGSVAAQKLLFRHSAAGDLTPLLSGYFDTTTGPKKVAASYVTIADAIGHSVETVLFATDHLDEARAAREAGMPATLSVRPGNAALPDHDFPMVSSLAELL